MNDKPKLYGDRNPIAQRQYFMDHMEAMTAEDLHSKADIACELAHRDIQIVELQAECERLKRDAENYCSVMIAAAEEIHEHWESHCDEEGYGPTNLMLRLENGIPAEYGYKPGTFSEMQKRIDDARLSQIAVEEERELLRHQLSALQSCQASTVAALEEFCACFVAANLEGLAERLNEADCSVGSLGDLVMRRLLVGYVDAEVALAKCKSQPQPLQPKTLLDFGYAPGSYEGRCRDCKQLMYGVDKRCRCCESCATKLLAESTAQPLPGEPPRAGVTHSSHRVRSSGVPQYDEICDACGATDQWPEGTFALTVPCPGTKLTGEPT